MHALFIKSRFLIRLSLVVLLFAAFFAYPAKPAFAAFTRAVFLQNVTTSSIEFRWVTDNHEQLIVKYGTSTAYGSQVNSDTVSGTGGTNNHAKITGLTSNTKYYYQVTNASGAALTPAGDANHYFRTSPPLGSSSPISFAFFGDSGNNSSNQDNVAKSVFANKPDLTFIAGDIAYGYTTDFANNNTKYFNHYSDFRAGQNSMSFSPYYVTCGNHETSCPTVMEDHSLPGGGSVGGTSTYSFDYGNVHFVALNSNGSFSYSGNGQGDTQMKWAYNDMRASSQPWKVILWHHNGWSAGSHSIDQTRQDQIGRLAQDVGAQLVFWGHSHVYERWNQKTGYYPNTQFFTIGNGGSTYTGTSVCTSTSPGPGCAFTRKNEAGHLLARVSGNQMVVQYYSGSSTTPSDSVTLTTSGSGPTSPPGTNTPIPTRPPNATNTPTGAVITLRPPTNTPTPGGPTNPPGNTLLRIESGGTLYTDTSGNAWSADTGFSGGTVVNRGAISIANTNDDRIYQTERYGMTSYDLNVPNGTYTVRLHFAETSSVISGAGQRVFSVNLEGNPAIQNLDVFSEAGGKNKALIKSADVSVSDGQLTIGFIRGIENPEVNGIEVIPQGGGGGGGSATGGDANCDGRVDGSDYIVWVTTYLNAPGGCPNDADFNNDGIVDGIDYVIWLGNYGNNAPTPTRPQATSTPGNTTTPRPTNTPTVPQGTSTPTVPVPTQPPGGTNPLTDCSQYTNPKRIFLETQAWWMDTNTIGSAQQRPLHYGAANQVGGHAHTATCFPQDQHFNAGVVHFNVRLMLHKGQVGGVNWLQVAHQSNAIAQKNFNPPLTCAGGRDVNVNCEWWIPIDVDMSGLSGYDEFRIRYNVQQPNGERQFASTGWLAWLNGGTGTDRTPPWTEARGWYTGTEYINARFLSTVPYAPISGLWTFNVALVCGASCNGIHDHGVHVDARFNHDDFGTIIKQGTGEYRGSITIDTRRFTNGPHCLALRTSSNSLNGGTDTGIMQLPFVVNNATPGTIGPGRGGCYPGT